MSARNFVSTILKSPCCDLFRFNNLSRQKAYNIQILYNIRYAIYIIMIIMYSCFCRLIAEFPPAGGIVTSWSFRAIHFGHVIPFYKYAEYVSGGLCVALILYMIVEEMMEVPRTEANRQH